MAATCPDHHVAVLLQDDVGAVIKVEDRDAVKLRGCTAGLGHRLWVDKMHLFLERHYSVGGRAHGVCRVPSDTYQRLHDGVIGGVHIGVKGESAFTVTVVRCVTLRRDDPVLISKATHVSVKYHYSVKSRIRRNTFKMRPNEHWESHLPSQIPETDVELMFFTPFF